MSGFTLNEKIDELQQLDNATRLRKKLLTSKRGRDYHDTLMARVAERKAALAARDFERLFDLESAAVKHDMDAFDHHKGAKRLAEVEDLKQRFLEFQNPANVHNRFAQSMQDSSGKTITDESFGRNVRALSRSLGGCIGLRSPACEVAFYEVRQECLKAILTEHNKNVERALYPQKVQQQQQKQQSKSLGRGMP